MTQTAGAFGHVANALTFFVNYYTYLAGFKSVVDRKCGHSGCPVASSSALH